MRLALAVAVISIAVACGGENGGSPVNPTPTAPTPPAPTSLTLSGTISESAPTSSTRIAGATVSVLDGPNAGRTATTDGNGIYRLDGLQSGNANVSANAPGYEEARGGISLTAGGSATLDLRLRPVFRMLDETMTGSVSGGDAVCSGSSIGGKPCRRFPFGVHHSGIVTARLDWSTRSNDLDLELWSGGTMLASSTGVGDQENVSSSVSAGASYELRVVYYGGSTVQQFTLRVQRPN
jgi:hypothetical protein